MKDICLVDSEDYIPSHPSKIRNQDEFAWKNLGPEWSVWVPKKGDVCYAFLYENATINDHKEGKGDKGFSKTVPAGIYAFQKPLNVLMRSYTGRPVGAFYSYRGCKDCQIPARIMLKGQQNGEAVSWILPLHKLEPDERTKAMKMMEFLSPQALENSRKLSSHRGGYRIKGALISGQGGIQILTPKEPEFAKEVRFAMAFEEFLVTKEPKPSEITDQTMLGHLRKVQDIHTSLFYKKGILGILGD